MYRYNTLYYKRDLIRGNLGSASAKAKLKKYGTGVTLLAHDYPQNLIHTMPVMIILGWK